MNKNAPGGDRGLMQYGGWKEYESHPPFYFTT